MVSIIIPSLNEELYIGELLESLKNQTYKEFEIIVADANSKDRTREIANSYGAIVIEGGTQSVGRNNGFKRSKGDILLFLDADISFSSNFLEKSIAEFNKRKLDLACAQFNLESEVLSQKVHNLATNTSFKIREKTPIAMATGATLFFKREVFEKLGGFKEDLRIAEDQEIVRRAKKLKFRFGVLNTKFKHSERRYINNGLAKMLIGGFMGMLVVGSLGFIFKKVLRERSEKFYGKWGEWD